MRAILLVLSAWVVLTTASVAVMRWVDPFSSAFIVRDRFIAWKDDDKAFVYRRQWVDFNRISPALRLAVIASEDQRFFEHRGFDAASINNALAEKEHGGRTRGASTITQQVAKNLFLWPGQSWVRKGIEAYFTVLIEALWPKRRILEIYLNTAEFGRGIYGAEAAAHSYFHKSAAQLSNDDAALLAAVLPSPKRFNAAKPSLYVRSRQHWILDQMHGLGGTEYLRGME
ncbi:MAG TPA: monofunctional biosynthetic peptidoglycan transglycosylase [Steroidobacteraceae bacterium]|nr:monofunctional biosynthetic peptidoglycan transglycosylase [Steroidobacteraceae bacterium]